MKKFSVVLAAVVLLGFLLAWNPGFSEAAVSVISGAQDPAQLATASVLQVKVTTLTDTILVLYRDSTDTATGSANNIKLTFYTAACAKSTDITIPLTPADVDLGDTTRPWISDLFVTSASGVVLGTPETPASYSPRWAMSGLVVDGDLGAVYERQGFPALVAQSRDTAANTYSYWAGFSQANFEDYYLYGEAFTTTVQLLCPDSTLRTDMNLIASINGGMSATVAPIYEITELNVYGIDEALINSAHDKTCSCFTENPGSIATLMANNGSILGTFNIRMAQGTGTSGQAAVGNRVITYTGVEGTDIYVDGRIRRSVSTGATN